MFLRSWLVVGGVGLAAVVAGCGGPRELAAYGGVVEAPRVAPSALAGVEALPDGWEELGAISAECAAPEPGAFRAVWLSDADCTLPGLVAALRERAARVGGELLVGTWCDGTTAGEGGRLARGRCEAFVARRAEAAPGQPAEPGPEAQLARTSVDYSPVAGLDGGVGARAPRPAGAVQLLTELPAAHVARGALQARCERCDERVVLAGLTALAGRLGGDALVEPRCVLQGAELRCTGTVSGTRVDPARVAAAR
jgi:hypothetical protein